MINKDLIFQQLEQTKLSPWKAEILEKVNATFDETKHGDLKKWKSILENLPAIKPSIINLNESAIKIGKEIDIEPQKKEKLYSLLQKLHPWRKGPFNLFGIFIDTEWRSDLKWNRLKNHLASLQDRQVLDIGCGSGYHAFRMKGAKAKLVVGLEPFLLSVFQFLTINHFVDNQSIHILPFGIEKFQYASRAFDTVFSMGVFYHRQSPFDHLNEIKMHLRSGGELVLETLVVNGNLGEVLVPEERYAKMRNVWFIPSCLTLESWLKRSRFKNIRLIDVTITTSEEQRSTDWMEFESLSKFLDPNDTNKTIEGYPAPKRAIFLAEAP